MFWHFKWTKMMINLTHFILLWVPSVQVKSLPFRFWIELSCLNFQIKHDFLTSFNWTRWWLIWPFYSLPGGCCLCYHLAFSLPYSIWLFQIIISMVNFWATVNKIMINLTNLIVLLEISKSLFNWTYITNYRGITNYFDCICFCIRTRLSCCNIIGSVGIWICTLSTMMFTLIKKNTAKNTPLHCQFLATLVALHFTPVSERVSQSVGHSFGLA